MRGWTAPIGCQVTRTTCRGKTFTSTVSDATHTLRNRDPGSAPLRPAMADVAMPPPAGRSPHPHPHRTESPMPETERWEYTLYIPQDPRAVTVSRRTLRLILTMHGLIGLADV